MNADQKTVLVVDDEANILEVICTILTRHGYAVRGANSGEAAIEMFLRQRADVVITDIRMPGMGGMALLKRLKEIDPDAQVIILTGHATLDMAVAAFKEHSAFDFLTKPQNRDNLLRTVAKAIEHRVLLKHNQVLVEQLQIRQNHLLSRNKKLLETQKALQVSRKRYQDLYNNAPIGYLTVDADGIIIEANKTAAELLHTPITMMTNKPFKTFIAPEGYPAYAQCSDQMRKSPSHSCELTMLRGDATQFESQIEAKAITSPNHKRNQARLVITDITRRKRSEEALKRSELRFRSFVKSLQGIAYQHDPDGSPIFIHGAVKDIAGYSEQELVQKKPDWVAMVHPEDKHVMVNRAKHLREDKRGVLTSEYRIRQKSGQWRWVREHTQSIHDEKGDIALIQGVIFDITEYKELQSQIIESRKLDAIATLAGGVAHQFNNALAGLVGYVELMQMDMKKYGKQSPHAESIFQLTQRMANLTQQLLAYAKGGRYAPEILPLTDMVTLSLNLMRNKIPKEVLLETDLSSQSGHVRADTTQMQMVLLALLQNAAEAIHGPGRILVGTRDVDIDPQSMRLHANGREGRFVCLSVRDEGSGMDEKTLKKIFDPFFTTKFIGRGLGLSAVYGIVSNHDGWLEVDSAPGKGTEVRIYLERIEAGDDKAPQEPKEASQGEGATVLVVEDEEQLMRATRQRLERLNFSILEAQTGEKALGLLTEHKGRIDVVLLDMRLPDIDGDQLYYKMTTIHPDLKIVLCSGYAIDEPVKRLIENGAHGFLQKPFSLATLSEKLNSVIERPSGSKP